MILALALGFAALITSLDTLYHIVTAPQAAMAADLPRPFYIQRLNNLMQWLIPALTASIVFLTTAVGLYRRNPWHIYAMSVGFFALFVEATILYVRYTILIATPVLITGLVIALLSLSAGVLLSREKEFTTTLAPEYNPALKQYRLISLYLFGVGLIAFMQSGFYMIELMYTSQASIPTNISSPLPLTPMWLKAGLICAVISFMSSMVTGSRLWYDYYGSRNLARSVLFYLCAYATFILIQAAIRQQLAFIIQYAIFLVINLAALTSLLVPAWQPSRHIQAPEDTRQGTAPEQTDS